MVFDILLQVVLFLLLVAFVMVGVVCLTLMERRVLDSFHIHSGPKHIDTLMLHRRYFNICFPAYFWLINIHGVPPTPVYIRTTCVQTYVYIHDVFPGTFQEYLAIIIPFNFNLCCQSQFFYYIISICRRIK